MSTEKKKFDITLYKKVMAQVLPYKKTFALTAFLAIFLAPLATVRPKLLQIMVDDHITKGDVPGMTKIAAILVGVLLLEVICRYLFMYNADWLGQSIIRDLRVKIFKHITNLKLSYFDRTPVGQNITRTIGDIEAINTVFSEGSITIIADLLTIFTVLGIMFWTSWKLTLVVLSVFPLLIWGSYMFKEGVRTSYEKVRNHIATMNSFLQERISGMKIVQIFNAEAHEGTRFDKINEDYTQANKDSILYYAIFFPVVDIISALSLGLMVWYGSRGIISEEITIGTLVTFPLFINMLYRPIRMLADKFNSLQMGMIAAERVFSLLDKHEKIPNHGTLAPERLKGNVSFEAVDFSYNEDQKILKQVSFDLKSGQTLAIVGSTGSGKSTIINLLNRFYDIQSGNILVDGTDIKDYEIHALRRRIGVVLQDVFLFTGTVMDNITLRDRSITKEKVIEAANMIGAHEFIERLPGGYDYEVMERGVTLSMGQRQLISFVRAIIFNPDILILDEATSSIDPESEGIIQYAIEKLIARRTSIIIAHRLSTIRHAHQILVLDKGEVREYGTPEELLAIEAGHYRNLYEKQFLMVSN